MRRDLADGVRALVLPTVVLLVVVAFLPGRLELIVRVYALVVCAIGLALVVAALRRAYPAETSLRTSSEARSSRRQPPSTLGRIEHEAALGVVGSFDLHYRLAPRLRSIAAGLLASRRRISLDAEPESAREILGEDAWELVRANRPAPEDRLSRGISPQQLAAVVDSLEHV